MRDAAFLATDEVAHDDGMVVRMISDEDLRRFSHAVLVTGSRSWSDEHTMRKAFGDLWRGWGVQTVTHPVLLSGHASRGADAMAERVWHQASIAVRTFPANWDQHGRAAGIRRNEHMIESAVRLREAGAEIAVTAFLDRCSRTGCPRAAVQQLGSEGIDGHFSHGTIHCRRVALDAGLRVVDVLSAH